MNDVRSEDRGRPPGWRGGEQDGSREQDRASERDWASERRAFAAEDRQGRTVERELQARHREQQAEQRQQAAERRSSGLADGGSWDYRERARLARKNATEHRAEAEVSRQRADHARLDAHHQYPLAARFAELAGHLFAAGTVQETLARVVVAAVDVIDPVDMASITLLSGNGQLSTPASTDELALRLDELQYGSGEGPCLEIGLDPGLSHLSIPDVSTHPRWPIFGPLAGAHGVHAVLSIGMFPTGWSERTEPAGDQPRLGSLNLYARQPRAFDHNARDLGLLLAAHAAVALAGATNLSQLRAALDSRDVIGQAKGILMARRRLTADQAFDVLRRTSQRLNMKLRDVAARIADSAAELDSAAAPDWHARQDGDARH